MEELRYWLSLGSDVSAWLVVILRCRANLEVFLLEPQPHFLRHRAYLGLSYQLDQFNPVKFHVLGVENAWYRESYRLVEWLHLAFV